MVSITFVIVLLAASCYSAPIDKQPDSSKLNMKNPKEQPVVNQPEFNKQPISVPIDHKDRSLKETDSDELTTQAVTRPTREFETKESDEVTTERINRPIRISEGKDSDEITTTDSFTHPPRGLESDEITTEGFTHPTRGLESDEITTEGFTRPTRVFEGKDSDEMTTEVFTRPTRQSDDTQQSLPTGGDYKRTVEDFLFTTLESSTKFNQRAIRPVESQDEFESSSPMPSDKKKKSVDDEPSSSPLPLEKKKKSVDDEPSSSPLPLDKKKKSVDDEPSSPLPLDKKKKSVDDEPSSVQSFGKSTGLLKAETSIPTNEDCHKVASIPDKMCETKINTNSPSKKSVVSEPVEQEQLSQVQDQSNIEKTKPNN